MAQKRYGPVLGPGVVVIEKDAGKRIEAAPLGVTGYVGILEKGPVGELISCYSAQDFKRICGGRISDSLLPDAVQDFFNHGGGAGEVHLIRVTHGDERVATRTIFSREVTSSSTTRVQQVMRIDAKNGGRWAGKRAVVTSLLNVIGDVTATTLTVPATYPLSVAAKVNEWKGGYVVLDQVTTKRYLILSNTAGTTPVITVTADSDMLTDLGGSLTDPGFRLEIERDTAKEIAVQIGDGEADATTLFNLRVYVDGAPVLYYPNLSMDPASKYYFANTINDDPNNYEIAVTDLNGGNTATNRRPACYYGLISAVTATTLQAKTHQKYVTGVGTYGVALGTLTAAMKHRVKIRCVVLAGAVTMDVYAAIDGGPEQKIGVGVSTSAAFGTCPIVPPFTLTPGGTPTAGDVITIEYFPFEPSVLINGYVYPDYLNYPAERYRITGNTVDTVTIAAGDMTSHGAVNDSWMIVAPLGLCNGYDGIASIADSDYYQTNYDAELSPFNDLLAMNKGLVRLATPGVTATAVQKAGLAFAEAKNWQYRVEIPSGTVSENDAVAFINSTIGRNDFGATAFPSFGHVDDPDKPGQLKEISLTGAIHGREAAIARNYSGYHKTPAGVDVVLSRVLQLDTSRLNEEVLNPQGINVVKFVKGNCIVWGARTIAIDSAWRYLHHRALMSYYEHVLQENFDWTIFQINDPELQVQVLSSLRAYFMPEWQKRALRGDKFEDACAIRVDNEINTDATRAEGKLYAEIGLRLADTVEQFIITVSKDGVFEQV